MNDRIEQIRLRWTSHDGSGVIHGTVHPMIEEELDKDVRFLLERLEESYKLNRYLENQLDKKAPYMDLDD